MSYAVEAENVQRLYPTPRGDVGLRDLTMQVPQGQVLALLGPNGAGKSTAIRGLATLTRFDRGRARVAGHDVSSQAHEVRRRIAVVGQATAVDDELSASQNLVLFARLRGLGRRAATARANELVDQFGLEEAQHRPVRGFSGGMRRRLDVAAALIVTPEVLFVDEPTTGLDPAARRDLWLALQTMTRQGTTVVLTTQYLEEADALADHIVLLAKGSVLARGTPEEIKDMAGPSMIQIRFATDADGRTALPALRGVSPAAELDSPATAIRFPTAGPQCLNRTVEALASLDIVATEVTLRRPSLDEAFLALTSTTNQAEESRR